MTDAERIAALEQRIEDLEAWKALRENVDRSERIMAERFRRFDPMTAWGRGNA